MRTIGKKSGSTLAAVGAALLWAAAPACSAGADSSISTSALSTAIGTATTSSGTLLCAPTQAQLDACSGKAASDACSLASADGGTGVTGTCRTTVDGASVACAPNLPAPPQALIDACSSHAAGDACQVTEADGDVRSVVCATARDGTTLACRRVPTPPQAAIDACSSHAAGDACALPGHGDGGTIAGVCSLGPAGTGPLACAPAQDLLPDATAACSGLSAGATCTLASRHESVSGSCVTPSAGGAAVCVVSCASLRGPFGCGPGGPGPGWHDGPGGGRGHGGH